MARRLERSISRRTALKLIGSGASALVLAGLAGCKPPGKAGRATLADKAGGIGPIDRTLPHTPLAKYSGEDPDLPHKVFRSGGKQGFLAGGLPEPSEKVKLVVVGGGISGLVSAFKLRHHQPLMLEQAERFGGTSRGESWHGIDYSIGAAYFSKPDDQSKIDRLLGELGLASDAYRERKAEDPVALNGIRFNDFWEGTTDPANSGQFKRLGRYFHDVLEDRDGHSYPEIPIYDPRKRSEIDALDRSNFMEHLRKVAGGPLHPHIETAIEHFCWSSLGASASEVSAACGLNFYCAEFGTLLVCPGGNAAIAEALLKQLARQMPLSNLRTGSIVIDVRVRNDGVQVSYLDEQSTLRSILARAVILACPKFVVRNVLHEIEPERAAIIDKRLEYRAYLVANVLLNGHVKDDFYDLFLLGKGRMEGGTEAAAKAQGATDAVLANYARPGGDRTVLTLYRAFPYPNNARSLIEPVDSYSSFQKEFRAQVEREILPLVHRVVSEVEDIRIARWGHPLPVAATGLIADGIPEMLRAPFRTRVFFVEQDNWALPAFETAVGEALDFAPRVNELLARG